MVAAADGSVKSAERAEHLGERLAPASIRAVIRRATWRARGVTLVEALCAGLAASALTASVARLQGDDELALGPLAAAALAGAAVALTWWVEHRPDPARIARRVDRKLAQDGALVTAFELEARAERSVLDELCLLRARADLEPRRVARTIPPPSLVFAGAALLALAGWFGARELVHLRVPTPLERLLADARAVVSGAASHRGAAERSTSETAAADVSLDAARLEVARVAARVDDELERGREPERELVGALADALERVADAAGGAAESAADAATLRELAERARSVSARQPAAAAASRAAQGPSNAGDSGSALANGRAERTMAPFGSAADAASEVPPGAQATPVQGEPSSSASLAGRWWSARHDAVVSAWIEARRARAARSPNEDESK